MPAHPFRDLETRGTRLGGDRTRREDVDERPPQRTVESDPAGTTYEICAIVSSDRLSVGRYGGTRPPAMALDCVNVSRG